jgi:hypothetical protein
MRANYISLFQSTFGSTLKLNGVTYPYDTTLSDISAIRAVGSGTVANATLANATVALGNSPGLINVTGDLTVSTSPLL